MMVLTLFGCGKDQQQEDPVGLWRIELQLEEEDKQIPFFLEIIPQGDSLVAAVWNGKETIVHNDVNVLGDSIRINSPYFNSALMLRQKENKLTGYWQDFSRDNYRIPLVGKYNLTQRFQFGGLLNEDADGKWEVRFSPGTEDEYKAIGLFETEENSMIGTFVTETGDYRFLEGGFGGETLKLSTFDGSHAFLFEANMVGDTLHGWFYSGTHWKEPFVAWRNDSVRLADPYTMTALKDPKMPIDFTLKDLDGSQVSLSDPKFTGKPVLLQIMGSWCPNCMDEAVFLSSHREWLEENGVEVVALSFERLPFEQARDPLLKLKENLGMDYPVLYAGKVGKQGVAEALPWLEGVKSYPTLVYVLPDRRVFRIHTGFYGPGTGGYFEKQSSEMLDDITKLVELSKGVNP